MAPDFPLLYAPTETNPHGYPYQTADGRWYWPYTDGPFVSCRHGPFATQRAAAKHRIRQIAAEIAEEESRDIEISEHQSWVAVWRDRG